MKSRRQSLIREDDDPLTRAMAPPPNETEAERQERLAAEKEAQKRSDAIDEELNRQRLAERKVKCVRVLLLGEPHLSIAFACILTQVSGQSESGMFHY